VSTIDWRATLTEALDAPGSLGNTYTRFYNYSFLNQVRLMMQGTREPVATYNRWVELGRQVRKGSKAKVVLAPVMVSRDAKDGNGKRQILIGFRDSRTVFGFSDTAGDELPPVALPGWDVETALAALKVDRVTFDMIDGNVQGFSFQDDNGRHLALNPTAAYPAKTLLHELAHLTRGISPIDRRPKRPATRRLRTTACMYSSVTPRATGVQAHRPHTRHSPTARA
jgi:hypothetical protein